MDDILIAGKSKRDVEGVIGLLKDKFDTVDLGDAKFLLGIGIERDLNAGIIKLSQEAFANTILDSYGMADARSAKTPAEVEPVSIVEEQTLSPEDTSYFRSATGALLYISRCTRPDITHTVLTLTRSMAKPGPRAMANLKRALRYLRGTTSLGITYTEDSDQGDKLVAYVDSDHAGDKDGGYSTTGAVIDFGGAPIDWKSQLQTVVVISSVEAEYVALSKVCTMILHLRHLLKTVSLEQEEATVIFEDNTGALKLCRNDKVTSRTKHVDIKFHHVRSLVKENVVNPTYISTDLQKADIFTKRFGAVKFLRNRLMLMGE